MVWVILIAASADFRKSFEVFTSENFLWFLGLVLISLLSLLGYRAFKVKTGMASLEADKGDRP